MPSDLAAHIETVREALRILDQVADEVLRFQGKRPERPLAALAALTAIEEGYAAMERDRDHNAMTIRARINERDEARAEVAEMKKRLTGSWRHALEPRYLAGLRKAAEMLSAHSSGHWHRAADVITAHADKLENPMHVKLTKRDPSEAVALAQMGGYELGLAQGARDERARCVAMLEEMRDDATFLNLDARNIVNGVLDGAISRLTADEGAPDA